MRMQTRKAFVAAAIGGLLVAAPWAAHEARAETPTVFHSTVILGQADATDEAPFHLGAWRLGAADPFSGSPPAGPLLSGAVDGSSTTASVAEDAGSQTATPRRRPVAFTYSHGYEVRAKIHKYASFATLPLFGAQYLLGQRLDEGTGSEPVRAAHAAIATTMAGLFGVNTVTGVWNLWEGRKDPAGRGRRVLHSLLMLGADAGFVATGLLAPTNDGGGNRSLHRNVAITSMGVASVGYLLMLLGN